jgi:hypothetical protein
MEMLSKGYFTRLRTDEPCAQCGHKVIRVDEFPTTQRVVCLKCLDVTWVKHLKAIDTVVARMLYTFEQSRYHNTSFTQQDKTVLNNYVHEARMDFEDESQTRKISLRWFPVIEVRHYYNTNAVTGWSFRLRHAPSNTLWILGELTKMNEKPGSLSIREISANPKVAGRHWVRLEQNYHEPNANWTDVIRVEISWEHTPKVGVEPDKPWPRKSEFGNYMPLPGPDVDVMASPPFKPGPAIGQRPPR